MTDSENIQALLQGNAQPLIVAANAAIEAIGDQIAPSEVAYFEPRMRDPRGHFAVLAGHYAQHVGDRAINVFHHRDWSGERPPHWHGMFPAVDHLVGAGAPVSEPVLAAFTEYTQHVISRCLAHSEAQIAVFPTARFLTLPGIARAVSKAPGVRGIIIGVMETEPVPDCDDHDLIAGAFRQSAETLKNTGKPLLLVAESTAIAQWLLAQGFSNDQLVVAPYPAAARFIDGGRISATRSAKPRFGALGATRPVHNPDLLARYLLEADLEGADWLVRLDLPSAANPLGMSPESLREALLQRGIELLPAHLDQGHYDRVISSLDVMLLPYGERYQTIGSGIFLECLCAGVTPLVPEGSTMAELLGELGGAVPVLKSMTPAGIATAVEACGADIETLRHKALARRDAWMAHPHGPVSWASRLDTFLAALNRS